ncbi:MAG: hypothetical protein Q8L85_00715 [Alphaproteobacteria bacterium]|nr:hypothetical protein [Alphaproteobacteria bacterium]
MSFDYLEQPHKEKFSLKKIDPNFSFLSLYFILFTFFIFLTSISTVEKQKVSKTLESVNEQFKGDNTSPQENKTVLTQGYENGGDYDQRIKGVFKNIMPQKYYNVTGKGELIEVKVSFDKIVDSKNNPKLLQKSHFLFEKLAYLMKDKINNIPLELTVFIGKTDSNPNENDFLFYGQKTSALILGQIARNFQKYGVNQQHFSIGFNQKLKDSIVFQFRSSAQTKNTTLPN